MKSNKMHRINVR